MVGFLISNMKTASLNFPHFLPIKLDNVDETLMTPACIYVEREANWHSQHFNIIGQLQFTFNNNKRKIYVKMESVRTSTHTHSLFYTHTHSLVLWSHALGHMLRSALGADVLI